MKTVQLDIQFPNEGNKNIKTTIIETPQLKSFYAIKSKYPDAIILFRNGNFYEIYQEDAVTAGKILNTKLTHRVNKKGEKLYKMTGFPFQSLDVYLPKLVRAGFRVAISDHIEN